MSSISQPALTLLDANGHISQYGTSGTPTLSAIFANVASAVLTGNDVRGVINFNVITATITGDNQLFTVNFAVPYASAPIILLTNASNQVVGYPYSVFQPPTVNGFIVTFGGNLPVCNGLRVQYLVMG